MDQSRFHRVVLWIAIVVAVAVGVPWLRARIQDLRFWRYYKHRHKEHEAGWRILFRGECIGELDYLHDEQPAHEFRLSALTADQQKIDYCLRNTIGRDPDSTIVFENRRFAVRVPDGPFCVSLREDNTVGIRDYRTPVG